ncbi:MAG: 2-oxoacid:acceptor oxidoreductase family protein [Planctomycetes bacterium]|nr:2-oxoacid:acceptor oxidoreductase family protein [Planctomycetota bacterium]MCK5472394.1 2-oxoacid:acceptor oxidoreductase family protein [Planctomycetota bacterium]
MQNTNKLYEEIIIAGFGGQGIMLAGKLLAQTAMKSKKEVTYMPSYGAEVRGGTANCMVVITEREIASPLITQPNSLIVMNKASLEKFTPRLKDNGLLIYNSSLIDYEPQVSKTIKVLAIPADQLAIELGNHKSANMVIVGAYLQMRGIISPDTAADCLTQTIAKRHHKMLEVNKKAIYCGAKFAKEQPV